MKEISDASLSCNEHDCECSAIYSGPLAVGNRECGDCQHLLRSHRIAAHAAYAADPATGRMPDDFEIAPTFR